MNNEFEDHQDKKVSKTVMAWNMAGLILILFISHLIVLSDIKFWALREIIGPTLIPFLVASVGFGVSLPVYWLGRVKQYWLLMPMIVGSVFTTLVLYQGIDAGPFKLRTIYEQQQLVNHGQLHIAKGEFPDERILQSLVQQAPDGWRVRETRLRIDSKDQYWVHLLQPSLFWGAIDYIGLYDAKTQSYSELVTAKDLWNEWANKHQEEIPEVRHYVAAQFEKNEFLFQCRGGVCHAKLTNEGRHILVREIIYAKNETLRMKQL